MFEIKISLISINDEPTNRFKNIKIINQNKEEILNNVMTVDINQSKKKNIEIETDLINYFENKNENVQNKIFETLLGNLQIMRVKSENLSLTDKYEFFRFLPITRNSIILILAIPDIMTEQDFINHIEIYKPKIKYIRFIKDLQNDNYGENESFTEKKSNAEFQRCLEKDKNNLPNTLNNKNDSPNTLNKKNESPVSFLRAIIYFDNQDSADNFYYDFNNKSFQINKFEFLYCVYIDKIYYEHILNTFSNPSKTSKLPKLIFLNPDKEQSELFCCPICLEKLDTSSSGIHTIVNMVNVDRWENFKTNCKVCRKINLLQDFKNIIKCCNCKSDENIWCCMICGFTGCDRYQLGHAVEHFNNTLHRYSIDLNSQRIWDYLGDGWVHRMIKMESKNYNLNNSPNNNFNLSSQNSNLARNNCQINLNNTIIIENENYSMPVNENLNTKEFLMRIENINSEYNFVLSTQLEEQRKYYEKEINKVNDIVEVKIKNKLVLLNELKSQILNRKNIIENNKKLIKECNKKLYVQDKKIEKIKGEVILNNELVVMAKNDIYKLEQGNNVQNNFNKNEIKRQDKNLLNNKIIQAKIKKKNEFEKVLEEMYNKLPK